VSSVRKRHKDGIGVRLPTDESATAHARAFARLWAADQRLSDSAALTVELVAAELVSNAIRHGTPPFDIDLYLTDGVIRGRVSDGSPLLPRIDPCPDWRGGFGLNIVAGCTERWGTTTTTGKRIWFEIEADG
jgi:two-component sensor histidine kinase